jgi:hypothetical protein
MSPVERGPSACQNTYGRVSGRVRSVRRWGSPPSAVLADSPYDTGRIRWSVAFEAIAARALTSCHDRCAVADESRELASTEVPPILFRRWGVARRARPGVLVAIACGGALGAVARFKVAQLIPVPKDGSPGLRFGSTSRARSFLGFSSLSSSSGFRRRAFSGRSSRSAFWAPTRRFRRWRSRP